MESISNVSSCRFTGVWCEFDQCVGYPKYYSTSITLLCVLSCILFTDDSIITLTDLLTSNTPNRSKNLLSQVLTLIPKRKTSIKH